jgi:hypothetical protein
VVGVGFCFHCAIISFAGEKRELIKLPATLRKLIRRLDEIENACRSVRLISQNDLLFGLS